MADDNVRKAGFTSSGISGGSLASSLMSKEAKASGGSVHSGGPTATLQKMGIINNMESHGSGSKGSTNSSGFTSSGISRGSQAAQMMSQESKSHGGVTPRGGTTATVQSISMGGKGGKH